MSLQSITLVFENCETVTIPEGSITNLYLGGITQTRQYDSVKKSFRDRLSVSEVYLQVTDFSDIFTSYEDNLVHRVCISNDITSVEVCIGGEVTTYFVKWDASEDYYSNKKQSHILTAKLLAITIGE